MPAIPSAGVGSVLRRAALELGSAAVASSSTDLARRATSVGDSLKPTTEQQVTLWIILGYAIFIGIAW